ncbi:regulatory protein, tetR family [Amycolatopsis arida]|uniref:Regulatory protein, tetR family n=1 Tax=Amycolatopsis arida TaxID=587909 RepID=A0A1I5M987_9PSEU|nr:TetR/AcrR family transcriptional regulator [Amycolatopsis arida]TDX94018.1 regulatory TetR family protein [Amycolatopsis arida]SFP06198.1 regulatory protein, tetR family [Amycolatopsis arida]
MPAEHSGQNRRTALRTDAERTVHTILEAAEQLLARTPTATMAQIAEAAGVSRTTVHRRFATREALLDAMAESALRQLRDAVEAADVDTAPPLVALHQATVNVLEVKLGRRIAFRHLSPTNQAAAAIQADLARMSDAWFARMRESGLIETEPSWARRVYYALVNEAFQDTGGTDSHTLADRVVQTFLRGVAPGHPA